MKAIPASSRYRRLDEKALAAWPLPLPPADGDKEERGRVLIIAGCREMPGVAALCATAALRAGAGKVAIATASHIAPLVGVAMPECRVLGLRETANGDIAPSAAGMLRDACRERDAVLIGPGMQNEAAVHVLVRAVLPFLSGKKLVLDAYAMGALSKVAARQSKGARRAAGKDPRRKTGSEFLITPHAGELAHLTGIEKSVIEANPQRAARTAARNWNTIVALKGAVTHIANPAGRVWLHDGGSVGLGTSGSGDTLAGIIVGLAARGATLEQAAAWGVVLHARAGARLESRFGPLGYMAREIAGEIPSLMHEIAAGIPL